LTQLAYFLSPQVAQMMLDGKELKFYQYNGDVNELLDGVRASLNELAEHWTREQKDHCLRETADAFQVRYSQPGRLGLLQLL
jgi:heme oxygenase